MGQIKLGARPQNFKNTVKFKDIDGEEVAIEMNYKFRTRTEYAEMVDEQSASDIERAKRATAAAGNKLTNAIVMSGQDESNVEYVQRIADGWNLDIPFDVDHLRQVADQYPGAMNAIISKYRDAITEGRLGN